MATLEKDKTRIESSTLTDGSQTHRVVIAAVTAFGNDVAVHIEAMDYDHALRIQRALEGGMCDAWVQPC